MFNFDDDGFYCNDVFYLWKAVTGISDVTVISTDHDKGICISWQFIIKVGDNSIKIDNVSFRNFYLDETRTFLKIFKIKKQNPLCISKYTMPEFLNYPADEFLKIYAEKTDTINKYKEIIELHDTVFNIIKAVNKK